jgi:hypothetical protein
MVGVVSFSQNELLGAQMKQSAAQPRHRDSLMFELSNVDTLVLGVGRWTVLGGNSRAEKAA